MFTGIIETLGRVMEVSTSGTNRSFWISSSLSADLKVDQSISHNGVCLTVEAIRDGQHCVTAIAETLEKTTLGSWQTGNLVNLERCLPFNGRLDGHFVQGHVDTTGTCTERIEKQGSWEFVIAYPEKFAPLVIEKGSVSLNGISLTAFDISRSSLRVAIIPYTFEHTTMSQLKEGDAVNIEFDLIGKYIDRKIQLQQAGKTI